MLTTTFVPTTKNSEKRDDKETKKKISDAYHLAKQFFENGEYFKALDLTEKTISDHYENKTCFSHHDLQGDIFYTLAKKTNVTTDIKRVYLIASLDAYSMSTRLCPNAISPFRSYARSAIELGDELGIRKFYEKAVSKAETGLLLETHHGTFGYGMLDWYMKDLGRFVDDAIKKMETDVDSNKCTQMVVVKNEQTKQDPSFERLKKIWVRMDEKTKREFLVVDFEKLIKFLQLKHGTEVIESFRNCVQVAYNLGWRSWKCHICSQVNYCFTDFKMHILDTHVHKFVPELSDRPECVGKVVADMISFGYWEPVDTEAAAKLINDRTRRREEFVYVNGWCSDWPVAAEDVNRRKILKQFGYVLINSCPNENNTLSCTLWKWLMDYTEENLQLPEVSGSFLDRYNFFKTPQCICFLDLTHLEYISRYFGQCTTRDVRVSLVSELVKRTWESSMVKERVDLERLSYNLLLDEKLLCEGDRHFDETGRVRTFKSSGIYEDVVPKGHEIVSWVLDCPKMDEDVVSQMLKGVHNREIWLASLRIVRGMVMKVVRSYDKRLKIVTYDKMLSEVETICAKEDNRKNAYLRSTYALALLVECRERERKQDEKIETFLNVVRDVLEGAESPRLNSKVLEEEESKAGIISLSTTTVPNDFVKQSLLKLRNSLKEKFRVIDSKILVKESACKELHEFAKLSTTEYRVVILHYVKLFLRDKLNKMLKTKSKPASGGGLGEPEPKKIAR